MTNAKRAPLSDALVIAVARLVDDAQTETREPSHSDIEFQIDRAGLMSGDPRRCGQLVGKAKRVRGTLSWAMEHKAIQGEAFVASLISAIRGFGGFRDSSLNFVGSEAIQNAREAFQTEGYELSFDGELRPVLLDNLEGKELTHALRAYVRRAARGSEDAALLAGTAKDLLEATAAHVLVELWGSYSKSANFPTLLGQAFVALELRTPQDPLLDGEHPQGAVDRVLYELGCTINRLRNKEGTGHGRPWLPSVAQLEARTAVELMGVIAGRLLDRLQEKQA